MHALRVIDKCFNIFFVNIAYAPVNQHVLKQIIFWLLHWIDLCLNTFVHERNLKWFLKTNLFLLQNASHPVWRPQKRCTNACKRMRRFVIMYIGAYARTLARQCVCVFIKKSIESSFRFAYCYGNFQTCCKRQRLCEVCIFFAWEYLAHDKSALRRYAYFITWYNEYDGANG